MSGDAGHRHSRRAANGVQEMLRCGSLAAFELEEARAAAEGAEHEHAEALFSRGEQLVGGFLGTLIAGIVLAVVFAAVYAFVRHRLPARTELARVALLAAIGFGIFFGLIALIVYALLPKKTQPTFPTSSGFAPPPPDPSTPPPLPPPPSDP